MNYRKKNKRNFEYKLIACKHIHLLAYIEGLLQVSSFFHIILQKNNYILLQVNNDFRTEFEDYEAMSSLFAEYKFNYTKLYDLSHTMIESGSEKEKPTAIEDTCKEFKYGNYEDDKKKSADYETNSDDTDSDEDDDDEKINDVYVREPLYVM